jgi:hypothetical protein
LFSEISRFRGEQQPKLREVVFRKCGGLCEVGGLVSGKRREGSRREPAEARMDANIARLAASQTAIEEKRAAKKK